MEADERVRRVLRHLDARAWGDTRAAMQKRHADDLDDHRHAERMTPASSWMTLAACV
jgi:hypothetical protein